VIPAVIHIVILIQIIPAVIFPVIILLPIIILIVIPTDGVTHISIVIVIAIHIVIPSVTGTIRIATGIRSAWK
jgi:hypothetical protein